MRNPARKGSIGTEGESWPRRAPARPTRRAPALRLEPQGRSKANRKAKGTDSRERLSRRLPDGAELIAVLRDLFGSLSARRRTRRLLDRTVAPQAPGIKRQGPGRGRVSP